MTPLITPVEYLDGDYKLQTDSGKVLVFYNTNEIVHNVSITEKGTVELLVEDDRIKKVRKYQHCLTVIPCNSEYLIEQMVLMINQLPLPELITLYADIVGEFQWWMERNK